MTWSGFAAFFSVFEITRRVATTTTSAAHDIARTVEFTEDGGDSFRRHFPRAVHGVTLVAGGVSNQPLNLCEDAKILTP